jgi:hypothetical protein
VTVGTIGPNLVADLDISEAKFASPAPTINITDMGGHTLTLSQAQAQTATISATNAGTVRIVVTGNTLNDAGLDLGATMPGVITGAANNIVVVVNPAGGELNITQDTALSEVDAYQILSGKTLLIDALEAGDKTFAGLGTIGVVGWQNYTITPPTFEQGVQFDVRDAGTLTLTAAQATGRTITHTGTGTGTVNIESASPATAYDFSGIVNPDLNTFLTFTDSGTLNTTTAANWASVDVVQVAAGQTLTLTAADKLDLAGRVAHQTRPVRPHGALRRRRGCRLGARSGATTSSSLFDPGAHHTHP